MFWFIANEEGKFQATTDYDVARLAENSGLKVICRHDLCSFADAEALAEQVNQGANDGVTYLATDAGNGVSPRFDVIEAPRVGAKVSKAIGADYYPDGEIVKVSSGIKMVVTTSTGSKYYRRKKTGSWVLKGGSFRLVSGHHSELDPSF
jgi:hypothetical protein